MTQTSGFYREVVESTSVALVVVGTDGVVRYHTHAAAEMLCGSPAEITGELFPSLFVLESQDLVDAFLRRVGFEDAFVRTSFDATCRAPEGPFRTIRMTAVNLAESPEVAGVVLTLVDRSEVQRAVALAVQAARSDELTGLLTRSALEEYGRALFTEGSARTATLALLDVDDMKRINDLHGFAAGDRMLRCVAERVASTVGDSAMVARFGGERFGILFLHARAPAVRRALDAAGRLVRTAVPGIDTQVTITCGVASTKMARHWPGVVSRAEAALLEAKISKPGGIFFYRRDTPGWQERRRREREALQTADQMVNALRSDVVRLEHDTRYDQRTGLLNAQAFDVDLQTMHSDAIAQDARYSLVLCDIDYFHNYNTRYLYQPANVTLRRVADALKGACRPGDRVYRYGGEEMTLLLYRTDLSDATVLAERVRNAVADLSIPHDNRPEPCIVTVSVGVAECDPCAGNSASDLVDAANTALLAAKQSGRNRVETRSVGGP